MAVHEGIALPEPHREPGGIVLPWEVVEVKGFWRTGTNAAQWYIERALNIPVTGMYSKHKPVVRRNGMTPMVVTIKNPHAWILSYAKLRSRMHAPDRWVETAMIEYNHFYRSCVQAGGNVWFIRHCDLVDDLPAVGEELAKRSRLPIHDVELPEARMQRHALPYPDNRVFDKAHYTEKRYMEELPEGWCELVDRGADWDMLMPFGFGTEGKLVQYK